MRTLLAWCLAAAAVAVSGTQANAAWYQAKSKHFVIYADQSPDAVRKFADRLERFDSAVRHLRDMGDPPLTDSGRLRIYVLKSEAAVARLAGRWDVAGFYHSRASGSVAFVPKNTTSSIWDLSTEQIFFHEYAHHLQLQDSSIAMPEWVREGFAEFFATAKVNADGSVLIGSPPLYRAWSLINGGGLSLEQILGGTYRGLNEMQEDYLYGEGWLLTDDLTFNKTRRGQLASYVEGIQKGVGALDSAKASFGDLRALDRELERAKQGKLMGITVPAKALQIGPIDVRPLDPGEAAIMAVHIRSTRGVDEKTALKVVADARKAAAPHPNNAFVQACLAEAEFDSRNYAAANAAADRALAADPNNIHATIYKGWAQMALARDNPQGANWNSIRSWFIKANKIDTEYAEPLALFYSTFQVAKQPPTKNAVEALLYAVVLAPQDEELRITAVRQLLTDNRLAEAKEALAPMAYEPHASAEWRELSAKIMDGITAGDAKAALALIDQATDQAKARAKQP
jgi:hypothetical protein